MFNFVNSHFEQFFKELKLDASDRLIADGRAERVAKSLSAKYYPNQTFNPNCFLKVGSSGKELATKPRTDLDMLFILPWDVYTRVDALAGNKQSALLQEVKRALLLTFPNTDLSADGQVVVAPFQTYSVDVVPAFRFDIGTLAGSCLICHTADGGSWKLSNPVVEYKWLKGVDAISGGKASDLTKMLKAWKRECNVEIKSICLEIAAGVFVSRWVHKGSGMGYSYHDYLVRDFFAFLLNYVNGTAKPAGINEWIPLGDCWASKCQTAYNRAVKACDFEHKDEGYNASVEWNKIFGSQFRIDWANSLLSNALAGLGA